MSNYVYEQLHFIGAGAVKLAPVDKATGLVKGPYEIVGDNNGVSLNGSYETYEVTENVSGHMLTSVSRRRKPKLELSIKLRSLSEQMKAYIFGGTASAATSVAFTDKEIGDVVPGKYYQFGDLKSVITEAKTGAGVAIPADQYTVFNDGTVLFAQAYTGVTVTGTSGAYNYTNLMSNISQEVAVLCDVKNMFNDGEDGDGTPAVLQIYRAVISPLDKFELIQPNGEIAEVELKLTALAAPRNAKTTQTGLLNGFGYFAE